MDATSPIFKWTWTESGLGYHATAMFLDDRPSLFTGGKRNALRQKGHVAIIGDRFARRTPSV